MFPKLNWDSVKVHVAQKAGSTRPIDVFSRSFEEWQNNWNGSFHSNHCWNREYIFSMIEIPNEANRWLFGGVFRVISSKKGKSKNGKEGMLYQVDLAPHGVSLIGRLVIGWEKDSRGKGRKPESILQDISLAEILPETYIGEDFPGYSNINHNYRDLENLWFESKQDWQAALTHCQGVYLITDTSTGLRYVGSAYGEDGIWSRWGSYFKSGGHGNNKLLKKLLSGKNKGAEYARNNFLICLLEHASSRDSEQYIIQRESHWKEALLTRGEYGLNEN